MQWRAAPAQNRWAKYVLFMPTLSCTPGRLSPVKLNHLHLTVTDVTAAAEFLERYIGLRRVQSRATSKGFVVLFDDEDLALTLMKASHAEEVRYHGHFHIDFLQANDEQ